MAGEVGTGYALRAAGSALRVTGLNPSSSFLVVVLVLEKAEYACKIRWGAEDEYEYKDEYETPAGRVVRGVCYAGDWKLVSGFRSRAAPSAQRSRSLCYIVFKALKSAVFAICLLLSET